MIEICLCAAILMEDGYIVRGHRHDDCLITAGCMTRYSRDKGVLRKAVQGFLTTHGRFVDRTEGAQLQAAAGLCSVDPNRIPFPDYLFSEDLY